MLLFFAILCAALTAFLVVVAVMEDDPIFLILTMILVALTTFLFFSDVQIAGGKYQTTEKFRAEAEVVQKEKMCLLIYDKWHISTTDIRNIIYAQNHPVYFKVFESINNSRYSFKPLYRVAFEIAGITYGMQLITEEEFEQLIK